MISINCAENFSLNLSLNSNLNNLQTALTRLSTGCKINMAKDNAANLFVSDKISVKISSMSSALKNTNIALDFLQTADSTLSSLEKIARRMNEIAITMANESFDQKAIEAAQFEIDQLTQEFNKIKNNATFNNKNVFDEESKLLNQVNQKTEEQLLAEGFEKAILDSDGRFVNTSDKIIISTEAEFAALEKTTGFANSRTFVLSSDIDLKNIKCSSSSFLQNAVNMTLDGNGYTILNLEQSLAQNLSNSHIKNVIFKNASTVGALIAISEASGSTFDNIAVIDSSIIGSSQAAALAGRIYNNSTIKNCLVEDSRITSGSSGRAGGFVASISDSNSSIFNCQVKNTRIMAREGVGGIAGFSNGNISNCYVDATISSGIFSGGLVGENSGSISNCYISGKVSATDTAGGISGQDLGGTISNCYSTISVSGRNLSGAIVGEMNSSTVSNSFYDLSSSNLGILGNGSGFVSSEVKGLSKEEISDPSTFTNAGFSSSIWKFSKDGPMLKSVKEEGKSVQIGASSDSLLKFDTNLDVSNFSLDVSTRSAALRSVGKIGNILKEIASSKSSIGTSINIFESVALANQDETIVLNMTNSTIKDADIAEESSKIVKANILLQVSSNILNQSRNLQNSLVMSLLS